MDLGMELESQRWSPDLEPTNDRHATTNQPALGTFSESIITCLVPSNFLTALLYTTLEPHTGTEI